MGPAAGVVGPLIETFLIPKTVTQIVRQSKARPKRKDIWKVPSVGFDWIRGLGPVLEMTVGLRSQTQQALIRLY